MMPSVKTAKETVSMMAAELEEWASLSTAPSDSPLLVCDTLLIILQYLAPYLEKTALEELVTITVEKIRTINWQIKERFTDDGK